MATIISELESLSTSVHELLKEAQAVAPRAYNKYSNYYVGAAVRTRMGRMYAGTYLDNVSTGLTICAEVAAIMSANTNADFDILCIAIVGGAKIGHAGKPITPCGRCRQIILEASLVSNNDIVIYCSNMDLSTILVANISELLPFPFERDDTSQ